MTRSTSIEAYHKIKDEGLLSLRRWQVYDVLFRFGPLTGNEVLKYLQGHHGIKAGNAPSIVSRLGELRAVGIVIEKGKRMCTVSGMKVILWDVNSKLPIKLEKEIKEKCHACNGKGYIKHQQSKMF